MGHMYTRDMIHRLRVAERSRQDRANFAWSMAFVWGVIAALTIVAGSL